MQFYFDLKSTDIHRKNLFNFFASSDSKLLKYFRKVNDNKHNTLKHAEISVLRPAVC